MKIQELRKLVLEYPKFPGTKQAPPASVCNIGFPGNFNLSFVESEWLKEFSNQYLNYDHDFAVSKIQPCIRSNDFEIIKNRFENCHSYLGIFEMADVGGAISLVDGKQIVKLSKFSVESMYNFLVKIVGLPHQNLKIKCCAGGSINDLSNGKYAIHKKMLRDKSIKYWFGLGINNNQIILDDTLDTALLLHIYGMPTPWGYRNEILYQHQGQLIDIGTVENLCYRPIFDKNKKIIDMKRWEHCFSLSVIGIERVLMVKNGYKTIMECDHIKPLLKLTLHKALTKNKKSAIIFTESLRIIHRIITDCGNYKNLSKNRKKRMTKFFRSLLNSAQILRLKFSSDTLQELLSMNSKLQKYYPELTKSIKITVKEILFANERLK